MMEEGEFFEIQPPVDYPLRDNYPYYGDGTGRSEPITIRNIKIRSDSDVEDSDDLPKKDTMRRSPLFSQPKGTLEYDVKGNDTLNSIALHFESTPTQLMRLNHLSSRMLYPGQTLYVPDPDSPEPICLSPSSTTKKSFDLPVISQKADIPKVTQSKAGSSAKRFLLLKSKSKEEKTPSSRKHSRKTLLRYETEPRPGRVIRDRSHDDDTEESKNFLKLNVKYITDGEGVVSGTMLVTPNAIMFDPNVSDPLVKERGTSPYGVITQMDAVRGAAMYHDISAMSLKTKEQCSLPGSCPVYIPANVMDAGNNIPTSPNATSSPTTTEPQTDPAAGTNTSAPDALLRTISDEGEGFVVVGGDAEKSIQLADPGRDVKRCPSIPEGSDDNGAVDNGAVENLTAENGPGTADASTAGSGELCRPPTTEGAIQNELSTDVSRPDPVSGLVVTPNEENVTLERILDEDSKESQSSDKEPSNSIDNSKHVTRIITNEDSSCLESQDQIVPSDSKGSLPDLVESAEQSVKDKESPTCETAPDNFTNDSESGSVPVAGPTSCPYCHPDDGTPAKLCNSGSRSPTELKEAEDGGTEGDTSPSDMPGFVNFSSGMFVRECQQCATVVPDIAESVQDTSATERELQTIRAEGMQIRRQSELLLELPTLNGEEAKTEEAKTEEAKTEEAKTEEAAATATSDNDKAAEKTMDVNKEVVLGYNKTNFEEYLPKPAQRYDDPPLYLCLRVGQPMSKTFPGASSEARAAARRNHKLPEYWFAIPRDKADNLYAFFLQWSPDVYGNEGNPEDVGFVAVDEELESSLEVIEDFFEEPISKDWEIITKEEANRRRMTILDCEMNLPLPELEGATSILLEPEHVRKLTKQLPARTEGYSWQNIYSTAEHGYSLRNLYRSMSGIDSPVLMVIRDSSGMIFGALSPCAVKVSEHYYGTGETFLFNFVDWELNVYRWTGENNFFIKGNYNSLTLGGGDGAFGLWLDGDLYRGRSRSCKTFSNPCLAHDEDFIIADLEAWGFSLG